MEPLLTATTILSAISSLFIIGLLYFYTKNLAMIKSPFTIGVFVFALLFLLQNLLSIYFYFTMMDFYVPQVQFHVLTLTILQTIAFAVLLKITWE